MTSRFFPLTQIKQRMPARLERTAAIFHSHQADIFVHALIG